jgi:hypothetical protein
MSMITFRLARELQEKKRQAEMQPEPVKQAIPVTEAPAVEKKVEEVASKAAEEKPAQMKPAETKPAETKPVAAPVATVKTKPSIASRK